MISNQILQTTIEGLIYVFVILKERYWRLRFLMQRNMKALF